MVQIVSVQDDLDYIQVNINEIRHGNRTSLGLLDNSYCASIICEYLKQFVTEASRGDGTD